MPLYERNAFFEVQYLRNQAQELLKCSCPHMVVSAVRKADTSRKTLARSLASTSTSTSTWPPGDSGGAMCSVTAVNHHSGSTCIGFRHIEWMSFARSRCVPVGKQKHAHDGRHDTDRDFHDLLTARWMMSNRSIAWPRLVNDAPGSQQAAAIGTLNCILRLLHKAGLLRRYKGWCIQVRRQNEIAHYETLWRPRGRYKQATTGSQSDQHQQISWTDPKTVIDVLTISGRIKKYRKCQRAPRISETQGQGKRLYLVSGEQQAIPRRPTLLDGETPLPMNRTPRNITLGVIEWTMTRHGVQEERGLEMNAPASERRTDASPWRRMSEFHAWEVRRTELA
ncbi:hypothetical protein BKA93DRAFT_752033 [Sparassis latifolia]